MPSRKTLKIGSAAFALLLAAGGAAVLRPHWVVALLARRSPDVIYCVETDRSIVALTIDDGPDPIATSKILDILRRYDARATFFLLTSRVPGNEEIVRRIVEEGHELANHLIADEPSILLDSAEFEQQLLEADGVLSEFAEVRWFRPGSGWYNDRMLSTLRYHGYRCALGSVYPFDPQVPSAWFATRHVLWNVRPGSIIVLHDCGRRGERAAAALAAILPELDRRGFQVVTLSELVDSQSPEE
jgi:peptidoglycan/xylan/chitin deacetylase (PgdA/CDA1 family)